MMESKNKTIQMSEDEIKEKCLTVDDKYLFAELFDFAYHECSVNHVIYEGKVYYPCTTTWYSRPKNAPVAEHDPDIECKGYWNCYEDDVEVLSQKLEPEKKKLFFELYSAEKSRKCDYKNFSKLQDLKQEIYEFGERKFPVVIPDRDKPLRYVISGPNMFKGKEYIYFPQLVFLMNGRGENSDHRGSNHMNIELDFHHDWTFEPGVYRIADVIEGAYRIKGNKFDNQYEAFFNFSHSGYDEKTMKDHDKDNVGKNIEFYDDENWSITPVIDHGS